MRQLRYNEGFDMLFDNNSLRRIVLDYITRENPDVTHACLYVGIGVKEFYGWLTAPENIESGVKAKRIKQPAGFNQWQLINLLDILGLKVFVNVEIKQA